MPSEAASALAIERVETDADLDAVLAIRNTIDPEPISRATLAARIADDVGSHRLIVRADGKPVAAAWASWTRPMQSTGQIVFRIWVLPARRGRGIGSGLFDELRTFAVASGRTTAITRVQADDAHSLAFVRRRGLQQFGRQQVGLYDLGAGPLEPFEVPAGIAIVPIGERWDLIHAVYDLETITLPQVPSLADVPPPSWEAWSAHLDEAVYLRDLSLVALEGEKVAGALQVDDDGDGGAYIVMLSVAPAMRRRGIARALKRELARRAAAAGWRHIVTLNDGTNDAIRRLNEDLGYRYLPAIDLFEGPTAIG